MTVTLRPVTSTRTYSAGLRLIGPAPNLTYTPSTDRVLLTIGGSTADLDRLSGATIVADLDVSGLPVGTEVPVTVALPTGLTLVTSSPPSVTVVVGEPAAPGPSPAPSGG